MTIATHRILVWRKGYDRATPRAWGFAGSKRQIKRSFAQAVRLASRRNWRRIMAIEGDYLTGSVLAEWHA